MNLNLTSNWNSIQNNLISSNEFYYIIISIIHNRIAGNHYKWDADTITFYEGEDFSGHAETYDEVVSSSSLDNPG